MKPRLKARLMAVKRAVIAGDPAATLEEIERFSLSIAAQDMTLTERKKIAAALAELSLLAEASDRGMRRAMERIVRITDLAHNFDVYDESGKMTRSSICDSTSRRY